MNNTQTLFNCLLQMNDKRWEWHANVPQLEAVSDKVASHFVKPYVEMLEAEGCLETSELEDWKKEAFAMGEDLEYKSLNIVKVNYIALQLMLDKGYRKEFLKKLEFFQSHFLYTSKAELQAKLHEIRHLLEKAEDLSLEEILKERKLYADHKYAAVAVHKLGLDKKKSSKTA